MSKTKLIKTALISVWDKTGLQTVIEILNKKNIRIISTGGTADFIKKNGIPVIEVESITDYPSILGGRVKTLHPKIFGGILRRSSKAEDQNEIEHYQIPEIDLVIVDLYPFEETLKNTKEHQEIIEKIDIGGISLIRAAAKNYADVLTISSKKQYSQLEKILAKDEENNTLELRKIFAAEAFNISSHYDTAIFNYFNSENTINAFKYSTAEVKELRYGENPHQKAFFCGNLENDFEQLGGKEISYNNLLDIDSAMSLIAEFDEPTCAVIKHTNACGLASRNTIKEAWTDALAGDPISAFGGIIICNKKIDKETAEAMNKLFFEVVIAPDYEAEALAVLKQKKNRRILRNKNNPPQVMQHRTALGGLLLQERDTMTEGIEDLKPVSKKIPTQQQKEELIFANKIVKHTKSNAIVLTKNKQLCASGVGQTSRVDALKQAIEKAKHFGFDLKHAVMASDAFFPFADSVKIAYKAGITAVIQPGGSIKDKDSIDYCNKNDISMVFTGNRHFKH